jgi:adenosylhomocysteinase
MSLRELFASQEYLDEKRQMKVMEKLIQRLSAEKPFEGVAVVVGHILAVNSLTMVEALHEGGAELSLCPTHEFVRQKDVGGLLEYYRVPVFPIEEGVTRGDFFLDEAAQLGQWRTPKAAAEVTRTGEILYLDVPCPVISVDRSKVKILEDFFGTGDSFVRAWHKFVPDENLTGKRLRLFGYGKVGRGVAHRAKEEGAQVVVADVDPGACSRADREGFEVVNVHPERDALNEELKQVDIVIGVTGIPGAVGRTVHKDVLLANHPVLVNMGYDEFGNSIGEDHLLRGSKAPVNLTLAQPTRNLYIDPALAAQVMALEELVQHLEDYSEGVHPLPSGVDDWILRTWRNAWPDHNLDGVRQELGLSKTPE